MGYQLGLSKWNKILKLSSALIIGNELYWILKLKRVSTRDTEHWGYMLGIMLLKLWRHFWLKRAMTDNDVYCAGSIYTVDKFVKTALVVNQP